MIRPIHRLSIVLAFLSATAVQAAHSDAHVAWKTPNHPLAIFILKRKSSCPGCTSSWVRTESTEWVGSGARQVQRLPEPVGVDFVVMTPLLRERLSTNVTVYRDAYPNSPDSPGAKDVRQATRLTVQLDIHGPSGADNAQIVSTLWRDATACDALAAR
ncbi:hypothetical protein [Caballeronia sp. SL2Y3]|uniref:phage neck terminator protein n=1 Tax=Caballeronia sp. SL2Y3 TaxID=2878151 RepID=UPI001FCFEB5B|nr:hypothetical protein [Caballeronia sp. SL2Y3]